MDLQINNDKAQEWVRQGAPNTALSYLGETVKSMSNFAEQNDILHKDGDETEEAANVQDAEVNDETADVTGDDVDTSTDDVEDADTDEALGDEAEETDEADENNDEGNSHVVNSDFMAAFSKSLNETITVAIKTYHDEVVIPLQKALEEITTDGSVSDEGQPQDTSTGGNTATKSLFEAFMGEEWLPAAVMVSTIKEQFASNDTAGDETVEDAEVDATMAAVDKELTNDNSASGTAGHAFNDF